MDFALGKSLFEKIWVASPASTKSSDGLGPLYNARSCVQCHIQNGKGSVPKENDKAVSLILKLGKRNGQSNQSGVQGDVIYGQQLQSFATVGHFAEYTLKTVDKTHQVQLSGGQAVTLHQPYYQINNLAYGELEQDTYLSARLAPALNLMDAMDGFSDAEILSMADPHDDNQDGVSGRPHWIESGAGGNKRIGRFGHKAQIVSLIEQIQSALAFDMGLSNVAFPKGYGDCSFKQIKCIKAPHGDDHKLGAPEVSKQMTTLIAAYLQGLTLPVRPARTQQEVTGRQIFEEIGCIACHGAHLVDTRSGRALYSDLLLHDMGRGLADSVQTFEAMGFEWRTAPLVGIGLTKIKNAKTGFLHDGRARTILEAILWHGGEAQTARDKFIHATAAERKNLLQFVESL
ncbi:MAG: di-heme oxidoredictase family protein [Arenicellales bacterium]